MSRVLWPFVAVQEGLPGLPEALDRRAGGGSKVEVALVSTHSLFDGPTRNSQRRNAALPP